MTHHHSPLLVDPPAPAAPTAPTAPTAPRTPEARRAGRRLPAPWRLAALLVLPLLFAGCFKIDIGIEVTDDGSGSLTMLAAFDQEVMEAFAAFGGEELDLLADLDMDDLPADARVEEYEEDGFIGARVTVPFGSGDNVAETVGRLMSAMDASGGDAGTPDGFEDFVLERTEDGWRFEASLDDTGTDEATDDPFARMLLGDASFTITLKLPGEIVDHNADEVGSDGRLTWDIDILAPQRTLVATSRNSTADGLFAGASNVAGLAAVIGIVAVAGIAGGLFMMRRREA